MTETDSAFNAWTSRDLKKMLAALDEKTHLVDRHFLFLTIVSETYKRRKVDPDMARICREISERHLAEFARIRPALIKCFDGILPRVGTFQKYATLLMEQGEYSRAVEVCEAALSHGLRDGTKSGFEGRIERIRKKAKQ